MTEAAGGSEMSFSVSDFMQRHKSEAFKMFELIDHLLGQQPVYDLALDIGGGYGDHLPFVSDRIDTVVSADIIEYLGDDRFSPRQLIARSADFGGHMDLSKVHFHKCDAHRLIYRDEMFDFVFSINAFEHIPNPVLALSEALRVARKGAPIYIQFDPIWNSPWGHHLPNLPFEPWAHLLAEEEEFCELILKLGGTEQDIVVFKTAMNRRPFAYHKRVFLEDFEKRFTKPHFASWSNDPADEPASRHPNFERCLAKGYSAEELVTRGVQFVGVKAW